MAHAVTRGQRITFHQALHGYADGHRQLATSANLTPRDTKTLLMLSDISGPSARLEEGGYLTGFPLTESGVYALARTWPAPEMSRPGCVWTHTLLIDFADLATIKSLAALSPLFRRPELSSYADYGKTTLLLEQRAAMPPIQENLDWGRRLLTGLYNKPRSRVIAMRPDGIDIEALVFAVWSQQWPRLRRAFRFCTWAAADRSSEAQLFDLQLLPPMDRSIRTRFQSAMDLDALDGGVGIWLDDAVVDLAEPDMQGLRSFLHRLGGDIAHGREGFRPLCHLHHLLSDFDTRPEALSDAVALLEDQFGSGQARGARTTVAAAGMTRAQEIDHTVLDFLLRNLGLVDAASLEAGADNLGRAIWRLDPGRLLPLLKSESAHRVIPERTLSGLRPDELLDGLRRSPSLISPVLERRPDVMAQPAFWVLEGLDSDVALSMVTSLEQPQMPVLGAIIAARRNDLAPLCVRQFGSLLVLQSVAPLVGPNPEGQRLADWIREASYDRYAVAQFLANQSSLSRAFLVVLARTLDPDAVPNEYGLDPWWVGMSQATGSIAAVDLVFLSAYLFCRALGGHSRNAADLARLGFETTHRAVQRNELPGDVWQALERRLPRTFSWFDWDRCPRLRAAVIDLFVDRGLAPEVFAYIVEDDHLFFELANQACRTSRGRSFLNKVYRSMKNESGDSLSPRIWCLENLLRVEN